VASVYRENHIAEWPTFGLSERWRRLFDANAEWLRVEEFHDGETLVIRAELPGIDPNRDVEITTGGGFVKIRAQREGKAAHKEKRGHRSEFRYGEFERDVALRDGVTDEDVKATYKDGILKVRIPCPATEHEEPKTVPVSRL